MESVVKSIKKQSLEKLYSGLLSEYKIYAPVCADEKTTGYTYNPPFSEVTFEHVRSNLSVKNLVFPKVETLFSFTNSKTENEIQEPDLQNIPNVILFGSHPCDNSAFEILKSIFCWDITDKFFAERLEKLTVIGLSCHKSDEYCFCSSAGLSPDCKKGSDILLTKLKNGDYKAEICTEKGIAIVNKFPDLFAAANNDDVEAVAPVAKKFSHEQLAGKLEGLFDNPFWVENSLRCLGCGACAYVCPTCACFDMQDETKGKTGKRYRSWDSCGFGLFTLHTSGHNPRSVQSQRWRQRIMHKFSYMPDRNKSLGCVGCGRCSSACPVDMNIAEQLEALQNI
jgi:formate hydrogenlyase subunit 6/NADH:ubiquinone oxidoreductase subunit I